MSNFNPCGTRVQNIKSKDPKFSDRNTGKCTTNKALCDVTDLLIVQKIPEYEEVEESEEDFNVQELANNELIAAEYQAVVQKQLQSLQADERGRQALNKEIADIKKSQEERMLAINARKKALEKEKERSRKIVSLPPPLPKSVQSLLKESNKPEPTTSENPENSLNGLTGTAFQCNEPGFSAPNLENKENMWMSSEQREKERIQAERDMQAQIRFNEALRKDRVNRVTEN